MVGCVAAADNGDQWVPIPNHQYRNTALLINTSADEEVVDSPIVFGPPGVADVPEIFGPPVRGRSTVMIDGIDIKITQEYPNG